jgi:single-stranded-DNA-specific exonuclease
MIPLKWMFRQTWLPSKNISKKSPIPNDYFNMKNASIRGKNWKIAPKSSRIPQLAAEAKLTPLQAQLLVNRGIMDMDAANAFLFPRLSQMIDPMRMKGMPEAISTIVSAVEENREITVYGDYDADGLTATALLATFLSHAGVSVSTYVPDRLKEGYGLNERALKRIHDGKTGLIITVDCGISNTREVELARKLGMEVVVTDHHLMPSDFEAPCTVVNPHQPGCVFPFKDLSGVGLSFFLAVGIRTELRKRGWFKFRVEPDLRDYLDLAALGTMADRVPLLGQNRMLVSSGLDRMMNSMWPGIRAIMNVAGVGDRNVTAEDLAYRIAPRLNAPGRMGDSNMGLRVLMAENQSEAHVMAHKIDAANVRRRALEEEILESAISMIQDQQHSRRTIVLASENWHKGVLGIVASRLLDRYHKPVMMAAIEDGLAVGSGRSIDGFDLYGAMKKMSGSFEKFGGHYHAAGFTLQARRLKKFREDIEKEADRQLHSKDLVPTICVDSELPLRAINLKLVRQINALAPFGEGNPEPVFMASSVRVLNSRIVGNMHLKLRLGQGDQVLDAIGFRLGNHHPLKKGASINALFTPEINRWQGNESVQLKVVDLAN